MTKIHFTKLQLVCELCGTQLINLEIHKYMLCCNWCATNHKRREQRKKDDAEFDRAVSPKNQDE